MAAALSLKTPVGLLRVLPLERNGMALESTVL